MTFSRLCTDYTAHHKEIFTLCYKWATSKIVRLAFDLGKGRRVQLALRPIGDHSLPLYSHW